MCPISWRCWLQLHDYLGTTLLSAQEILNANHAEAPDSVIATSSFSILHM